MKNSNSNNIQIVPAERVNTIKEYYFSKKLREIAQLNAKGADIISLGIGGPDLPPDKEVVDTLCNDAYQADAHSYQPYVGLPTLRKAYADWYKKFYDVELNPASEIQPLIGSKEGILHITLAFINPGDGVLIPNPGYPTYTSVSKLAQANIYNYNLDENNGWKPDFEALEKLPLDKVKLMWVNYPNMPTGAKASQELFKDLIDFGKRHNILIVNDNPYSFILHEKPISILSIKGAKDVAIELNSLSKSHNMAGWRMGMIAANPQFIEWILKVKSNIDSGQFRPMMMAAIKALSLPESWYKKINQTYSERRKIAEDIMNALHCEFDKSQGGLFLWGKIPSSANNSEEFTDKIFYEAKVFLTPGFIFGSNGDKYIRISLCAKVEKLREALDRINKLMNK